MQRNDEYSILVWRENIAPPTADKDMILQSMHMALERASHCLCDEINALGPRPEVISHDVTTYGNMLFLSVLIRHLD